MSYRYANAMIKPGLNTLVAPPAPIIDYSLYVWGENANGQLGLGDITKRSSPVQVGSLTNWLSISSGFYSSYSIKTDGTLWAWGRNTQGQLGLGNRTNYSSPKQVGALTNWLRISSGTDHTAAVKTDGKMWTSGQNANRQL